MNPRDLQFQCIPRNDHAVVFLHGLLNRQTASISHKKFLDTEIQDISTRIQVNKLELGELYEVT